MQKIAAKNVLIIVIVILSMTALYGCAGLERAPKNRIPGYAYYHKPLPEADRTLDEARSEGKDKKCPADFDKEKAKVDKAYEIYMGCNTKEAIKLAQEAIDETKKLCPPEILGDIHFDFDKATLTHEAIGILKKNIKALKENPALKVQIEGHACAHGPAKYNRSLSERRANAVMEYLVKAGVPASRLTTIAYGNTRLAVPEIPTPKNKNSSESKMNRRVHFEITSK